MKVYLEEQRMTSPLVIIALSVPFIGAGVAIFNDWKNIEQSNIESRLASVGIIVLLFLVALLIFSLRLKTRIDEKGVHYQFYPIHFSYRLLSWNEISKCYVRKYNAIFEYGGWGFRNGFRKKIGKAYNVKGNIGLQLELKNGKKILIGTQKKEEIQRVIETYGYEKTK